MKYSLLCLIYLFCAAPLIANQNSTFQTLCYEVEQDASLTPEQQNKKTREFKNFAKQLSPEEATQLTHLLLQETRSRIVDILQNADLDSSEINSYLADYEYVVKTPPMNVTLARQLLFFVAELKIHRQYVYDFGTALGCPKKQLLRHDLSKLSKEQLEGYARYFRGGRREEDRAAFLKAWEFHQREEHHVESYSRKGFDFDSFPEEKLRNNMLEIVADWLASAKQRGGGSPLHYLVTAFPKKKPHPRLLPYLKDALLKAHALYTDSHSLFKDLPCWNSDVEKVFAQI